MTFANMHDFGWSNLEFPFCVSLYTELIFNNKHSTILLAALGN